MAKTGHSAPTSFIFIAEKTKKTWTQIASRLFLVYAYKCVGQDKKAEPALIAGTLPPDTKTPAAHGGPGPLPGRGETEGEPFAFFPGNKCRYKRVRQDKRKGCAWNANCVQAQPGAANRGRTGTEFLPRDFKSLVSAYSTIAAFICPNTLQIGAKVVYHIL